LKRAGYFFNWFVFPVQLFVAAVQDFLVVEDYRVDFDFENGEPVERSAAVNMALDEHILERAAEEETPYLRIYGFEEPSFVPSRRTSAEDIADARSNGHDYSRRNTNGSTIPCLGNGLAYSVAYPTEEFPDRVFTEKVAPALVKALEETGVDSSKLNVGKRHDSIRYGGRRTPADAASGKTLLGSSLWRNGGSVLSHGVVAAEPWDAEFLDRNMDLRIGEQDFIEKLPSVQEEGVYGREELAYAFLDAFTDGDYTEADLENQDVEDLLEVKYSNPSWVLERGDKSGRGHCFVEQEDGRFY
jgi:lipoate-protein ligase A